MSKKIKIIDLVQDDKNFNKHTQYGMSLLEKSIEKVGVIESVTISADDKVISGNARQEIMALKFENTEPIIIETDGTRPVILKRTDIKSNTKQFHEAALLANTVSKKNIDLDLDLIDEVAVEEFGIDVEELGVDIDKFDEQNLNIKKEKLIPFKRTHILLSFDPNLMIEIQEYINEILKIDGVEYEQASN